jgi:hypothetical protein
MKITCFALIIIHLSTSLYAQTGFNNTGSRSNAMGDASVTISDVFSVMNNQGALGFVDQSAVGLSAQNMFGLEGLHVFNFAAALTTNSGNFGVSVQYFGDANYHQTKAGIAYGRKLSETFGAGLQLDYISTNVNEVDAASAISFEAGITYSPYKTLEIGARVFNPIRARIGEAFPDEEIPVLFTIGMRYIPSDKVFVAIEGEQLVDADLRIKSGIEYHIIEALYMRCGYLSNPSMFTCGAGLALQGLQFDFAAQFHQQLGMTPGIGILYALQ